MFFNGDGRAHNQSRGSVAAGDVFVLAQSVPALILAQANHQRSGLVQW
jgi:hypothetical protein